MLAARTLTESTSPTDQETIVSLLYVRLACLSLIGETALAAQESNALQDFNGPFYRDSQGTSLVPWELRVLATRLQGLAADDWRRTIMGYYKLASECRYEVGKQAISDEEKVMWEKRLSDLGIRVANACVEMGDLETAVRHLKTLERDHDRNSSRLALLYLKIGDVETARRCIGDEEDDVFEALCAVADGDYDGAIEAWRRLKERDPDNVMAIQNLAACLLYAGKIEEVRDQMAIWNSRSRASSLHANNLRGQQARSILETLVDDKASSVADLTFNLCTLYELCTEKSRDRKMDLARKLAEIEPSSAGPGWERTTAELKL